MKKVILALFLVPVFVFSAAAGFLGNKRHPLYKAGAQAYKQAESIIQYDRFDPRYQVPVMPKEHFDAWDHACETGDWSAGKCQFGCGWLNAQSESLEEFGKMYKKQLLEVKQQAGTPLTIALKKYANDAFQTALEVADQKRRGYNRYKALQRENLARGASYGDRDYQSPQLPAGYFEIWEKNTGQEASRLPNEYYFVEGWMLAGKEFVENLEAELGAEQARELLGARGIKE